MCFAPLALVAVCPHIQAITTSHSNALLCSVETSKWGGCRNVGCPLALVHDPLQRQYGQIVRGKVVCALLQANTSETMQRMIRNTLVVEECEHQVQDSHICWNRSYPLARDTLTHWNMDLVETNNDCLSVCLKGEKYGILKSHEQWALNGCSNQWFRQYQCRQRSWPRVDLTFLLGDCPSQPHFRYFHTAIRG